MNPDRTRLRFQVPANAEPGECIHLSLVQRGWNGRIDGGMDIEIRVRKPRKRRPTPVDDQVEEGKYSYS